MIRRLDLRTIIMATVAGIALAGAVSSVALLTVSARRHAAYDAQYLQALEDESVAETVRRSIDRQLEIVRAQQVSPSPLLAEQFERTGTRVHDQLRFYLFRPLSAAERRLVERIQQTHARIEVHAQRSFLGLPSEPDDALLASLTRDLDRFAGARRQWRAGIEAQHRELARGLITAAAGIALVFLLFTLLLLRLLQRRLLDRLDGLRAAALRVGAGDFGARVPVAYDDELTELSIAFNRMVDEREGATRALEASEERYRSLFDRTPVGLYRSTPDGRFLDVNRAATSLLGYTDREQLLRAGALLPPPAREVWKRQLAAMDGPHQVTWEVPRPDGLTVWVRDTAHAVRDADGAVVAYEGALEDVTERVLAQRALERSEARFRSLIENGSEAILVLDATASVRYQSPAVQRMLGYGAGDENAARPLDLLHPADLERVAGELTRVVRGEPLADAVELRCRARDGEYRTLRVTANNMLHDPHVRGVVVNMQDITEQRQLEERFLQSQKMEAVGRLAGGIAHDFNNLLTAIGGYTDLLHARAESAAAPLEELTEIRHAVERAAALTRQLLAFSRQQVVQPRPLCLGEIARGMRAMLHRIIGEDIELETDLSPDEWVLADPGQIEQVLLNFVVNARDAMPAGGTITIRTAALTLDAPEHGLPPGRYVELAVKDTGHGMTPDVLAHAFDPFFTTKDVGKGTGLGLATVYGIAVQAGGAVRAESRPGEGSRFTVLLPRIAPPAAVAPAVPAAVPSAAGGERVLLVEDEPAVRGLAERVLRRHGYEVASAANGREALRLLAEDSRPYHLVVTDVVMPEVGGPELVEQALRLQPHLHVLYMSGYARESFARTGVLSGSVNFLEKPFTPEQLARRVRELLDQADGSA